MAHHPRGHELQLFLSTMARPHHANLLPPPLEHREVYSNPSEDCIENRMSDGTSSVGPFEMLVVVFGVVFICFLFVNFQRLRIVLYV